MSTLTPADITPGVVVTNGRGRFRLIVSTLTYSDAVIATYEDAYVDKQGKMQSAEDGACLVASVIQQFVRLATPGERADVIRCLNPKGIE